MKNSLQKSFEWRTKNAYNNKISAINEDPDLYSLYGFKACSPYIIISKAICFKSTNFFKKVIILKFKIVS